MTIENITMALSDIAPNPDNPRVIKDAKFKQLCQSITDFPDMLQLREIVVDEGNMILGGNQRYVAMKHLKYMNAPVKRVSGLSPEQKKEFIVKDNMAYGEWDYSLLGNQFDLDTLNDWGLNMPDIEVPECADVVGECAGGKGNLSDRFGVSPFTVLNSREGWWQNRKHQWLATGIKSELGRANTFNSLASAYKVNKVAHSNNKISKADVGEPPSWAVTSIFDPVLCELAYEWFAPMGGLILDPFAGGSVRGIVAAKKGYQYIGIDLSETQITANREQATCICDTIQPVWHCGDSANIESICRGVKADFLFSCPPYADLEVYSDAPGDLSNMPYDEFRRTYAGIIKSACRLLKPDSFACFVVGEVRDKKGNYYNFVGDTIQAFIDAGLKYYNEAILVTCAGSLPVRITKQFTSSRKLGKTHQNVLVFIRGDAKRAAAKLGNCEFGEIESEFIEVANDEHLDSTTNRGSR